MMCRRVLICFLVILIDALYTVNAKTIVLGGGNMKSGNDAFYGKIVQLAGGRGTAKLGIITAANKRPEENFAYYRGIFESYGVLEAVWIPIHQDNLSANSDPLVIDLIRSRTGFFFGGGNRERLISTLYNDGEASPALLAIRDMYNTDVAVVSGVSAGMVSQSTAPMILYGESWNALRNGACETSGTCASGDLEYDKRGGLKMYDGYILDSHFAERGREGRLIRMIADTRNQVNGVKVGLGVDEDTALVVTDVGTNLEKGEVIGMAGVYFADLTAAVIDDSGTYWRIDNVKTHYLTEGDTINMVDRQVTIADFKETIRGREQWQLARVSYKIFNGNADDPTSEPKFVRVGTSLVDCTESDRTFGDTEDSGPMFRVDFILKSATAGFVGTCPSKAARCVSYTDMELSIGPKTV